MQLNDATFRGIDGFLPEDCPVRPSKLQGFIEISLADLVLTPARNIAIKEAIASDLLDTNTTLAHPGNNTGYGYTALYLLAYLNHFKQIPIKWITQEGLTSSIPGCTLFNLNGASGNTPLHWLAKHKQLNRLPDRFLTLENLSLVNDEGQSVLYVAALSGSYEQLPVFKPGFCYGLGKQDREGWLVTLLALKAVVDIECAGLLFFNRIIEVSKTLEHDFSEVASNGAWQKL